MATEKNSRRCEPIHRVYHALSDNGASRNEAICFNYLPGETMIKIQYLLQQASRAERLAKNVMDRLTTDRLQVYAAECRTKATNLNDHQLEAA